MPTVSVSRELLAPLDDVWAFVAEPHNFPNWWPRVGGVQPDRLGLAPGRALADAGRKQAELLRRPEAVGHLVVLAVEAKRLVRFHLTGDRLDVELTLEPSGENRTRAELRVKGPGSSGCPARFHVRRSFACTPSARLARPDVRLSVHVTSLAAVFIALVIGILVGVAISGRSLIRDTERRVLENDIAELQQQLSDAERQVGQQNALEEYARVTYPAVMAGRLADRRIGVVYVGSAEGEVAAGIQETIDRADGVQGMRALQVPIATESSCGAPRTWPTGREPSRISAAPSRASSSTEATRRCGTRSGRRSSRRREGGNLPLDAVVVARTAEPQSGQTARFLSGFYSGLAAAGVPVVGVETTDSEATAVPTYRGHGFSTSTTSTRSRDASRSRCS
jgi:uncharacterized protein YndB with AHSA1/START domain